MLMFLTILLGISLVKSQNNEGSTIQSLSNLINLDKNEDIVQKLKHPNRNLQTNTCDPRITCSGHGICADDGTTCICNAGFITFPTNSSSFCNYEQKRQLNAFLFELIFGFGAGHFYTERYTVAALKLSAFVYGIFIICMFPLTTKYVSEKFDSEVLVIMFSCFYYLCALGLAFWFIYDLINFGMNNYKDGNGAPLLSWTVPVK